MWKLHRLPESVILDRRPQFVTGLIKELNEMLEIETKLFMAYYLQLDEQTERTNQELEQYLRCTSIIGRTISQNSWQQ